MKRLLFAFLLITATLSSMADTLTIKELFKEMPDSIIPYLSKNNRLDFIDFMESKMKAEVTNEMGGKSLMTELTDDSISICLNEACRLDMLLLNVTHDVDSCRQVIAIVRTVGLENDIQESEEPQYFSVRWKPITDTPQLTETSGKRLLSAVKAINILNIISKRLNKD